jgi:hypothetical protein
LAGFITKFKQAVDKIIEGKPGKDESFNAKEGSLCKKLSDVLKKSNWSSDYEIGLIQLDLFFKQAGSTKDDIKPKDVLAFTLFLLYVDYSFPGKIVDMNMQHEIPHIKRLNCELTEDLIKENVLYFLRAILDFFAVNFQEK